MFFARCNLFQDKIRLALSVSVVALAVTLILLLNGSCWVSGKQPNQKILP